MCPDAAAKPPRISVAIPVYNEESNLPELLRRIREVLEVQPGGPHELVFVDDGSSDGTLDALRLEAAQDPHLTVVGLARNFGHQTAVTAALDYVKGDVVVVMDGDLQDNPKAIPGFVAQYLQGHDVVYAIRKQRKEGLLLRACYALFYRLMRATSDIQIPMQSGDFGLMSRRVVKLLCSLPERQRYVRGLRSWVGFRQVGVEVERDERFSDKSKYTFSRLVGLALDGLFSFSVKPIRFAMTLGLATVLGCFIYAVAALYAKLVYDASPRGFTTLILFMFFLFGVQLLFMGVIGEYVGRVYEEVKRRPHYVVDDVWGANRDRFQALLPEHPDHE